ncbi:MAG: IS110 family transposase [Anaerolineae bacterium]
MARRKKKKTPKKIVKLEALQQINFNAAGLDIGAAEIWAAVPEERDEQAVRRFATFTIDLHALADWLAACGVDTVAMESTGVYWVPIFEILEARDFEVLLVNARHIKNVTGRKTDVLDCQWIQQLHTYGLLQGSFRPRAEIATLRAYVRHRDNLLRYRAAHIQHMQKALHLMNVQLTNVLSDITGQTGIQIIRAIVAGARDPVTLAQYRDPRCHSTEDEIAKALTGNYRPEHVFALQQAVELYDFYTQQLQTCDAEIEQLYSSFAPKVDIIANPLPPAKKKRRKNDPDFDLRRQLYQTCGVDLTRMHGLDSVLVQEIISEIGVDMSKWKSSKHFASWLRLCPYNDISGGKVLKSKTGKTTNRANRAFRLAARSAGKGDSALGAFYRRQRAKHGAPTAITATAHKIARIVYHLLKYQEEYHDPGREAYEAQYQARMLKNLQRKAKKLGMKLEPLAA